MSKTDSLTQENYAAGDAAVDGLLNGVIAGVGMGLYVLLVFLVNGLPINEILSYFSNMSASPVIGALVHLAVSGIYGVLFGLAYTLFLTRWTITSYTWFVVLVGIVYGGLLWLVATFVVFRSSLSVENISGMHLLIAHLIFGLMLGLLSRNLPEKRLTWIP